jgi:hypothetical protein
MMGVAHPYASFVVESQMSHVFFVLDRSIREQGSIHIHPWVEIWVDLVGEESRSEPRRARPDANGGR